jgi:predicted GIY-YIG superfamily endonuclease
MAKLLPGQPGLFDVDKWTCYRNPKGEIPDLGLSDDLSLWGRVYLLKCKPQIDGGFFTYYTGFVPKEKVGARIAKQARRLGAKYTRMYGPLTVELVWPAAQRSSEAYVFYTLVDNLPPNAVEGGRVGGWTQTLPNVSPLGRFVLRREKRMVSGQCLDCGAKCFAGECPKPAETMPYHCDHCGATIRIANHGKSDTETPKDCQCPPCKRPRDSGGGGGSSGPPPKVARRAAAVPAAAAAAVHVP